MAVVVWVVVWVVMVVGGRGENVGGGGFKRKKNPGSRDPNILQVWLEYVGIGWVRLE